MKISCDIVFQDKSWKNHAEINKKLLKQISSNILSRFPSFRSVIKFELAVLLSNDSTLQSLNKEFRNIDKPTNVLSFPDVQLDWKKMNEFQPDQSYMYLGDLAMSYHKIKSEAQEQEKSFHNHFVHLFIHGVLHLIGFDHIDADDAEAMESIEIDVLNDYGIPSPY